MGWSEVAEMRQMQKASKTANAWYPYLYINYSEGLVGGFGSSDMTPYQHGSWWEVNNGVMNVTGRINTDGGVYKMTSATGYSGEIWSSLPNWSGGSIPPPANFTMYRIVGTWWLDTWPGAIGGTGLCELTFQSPAGTAGALKFLINRYHDSTLSILSGGSSVPYYFDGNSGLYYNIQYEVA